MKDSSEPDNQQSTNKIFDNACDTLPNIGNTKIATCPPTRNRKIPFPHPHAKYESPHSNSYVSFLSLMDSDVYISSRLKGLENLIILAVFRSSTGKEQKGIASTVLVPWVHVNQNGQREQGLFSPLLMISSTDCLQCEPLNVSWCACFFLRRLLMLCDTLSLYY